MNHLLITNAIVLKTTMPSKGKKQSGGEHKPPANMRNKSHGTYNSVDDLPIRVKTTRVKTKKITPKGEIPFDSAVLAMLSQQAIATSKKKWGK